MAWFPIGQVLCQEWPTGVPKTLGLLETLDCPPLAMSTLSEALQRVAQDEQEPSVHPVVPADRSVMSTTEH